MDGPNWSFGTVNEAAKRLSPFGHIRFSAVAMVLGHAGRYGGGPVHDEEAVDHLWQLLMALQMPIIVFFFGLG